MKYDEYNLRSTLGMACASVINLPKEIISSSSQAEECSKRLVGGEKVLSLPVVLVLMSRTSLLHVLISWGFQIPSHPLSPCSSSSSFSLINQLIYLFSFLADVHFCLIQPTDSSFIS